MENYLLTNHRNDIIDIMNNSDDSVHSTILVNLTHLQQTHPDLFTDVVNDVHTKSLEWSNVLLDLQKRFAETDNFLEPNWLIKENCRVRFDSLSEQDRRNRLTFPTNEDVSKFVQIKGTVLRATQPKFLEHKTDYICGRCKQTVTVIGEYGKYYVAPAPTRCPNGCKGRPYSDTTNVVNENFMTYQEIKIMEAVSKKSTPSVMDVTLDDDLVESCQPGDSVTICGTVESRWLLGHKMEIKVVIRANSVNNKMKQANIGNELPEHLICLRAEWNELTEKFGELGARDILVQSICPDVHGMFLAKLAIALAICSGYDSSSAKSGLRNHSHVLLIGDPGLAKSRLLKFAVAVSTRSTCVTGSGISSAGLTAAAIQEGGEWHLDAGALPLSDNGICCIDEFNMMSDTDKASLHEAMEQQTIHISKAGIACKLNTRCTIIAATNPKNLYSMSDNEGTSAVNLGLASSLVSRFDLVLILRDERNTELDTRVANHIFYETGPELNESLYDLTKLQAHFAAVRDFDPTVTVGASRILKAYYLACRADEERDAGRTTIRFNDSLYRLAKSHAKLLFRNEVTEIDAVLVVMLMESSFGFGRILQPKNVLSENLPLGPSDVDICELLDRLNLEALTPPNDGGTTPNDCGTPTNDGGTPTNDCGTTPNDGETTPNDGGTTPNDGGTTPNDGGTTPNDGGTHLNGGGTPPNDRLSSQHENPPNGGNETINRSSQHEVSHPPIVFNDKQKNENTKRLEECPFPRQKLSRSFSNENLPTTKPVSALETSNYKSQPAKGVLQQSLLQNIEMKPASSIWKRFRKDLDDEELDQLFTLDEPMPKKSATVNVNPVAGTSASSSHQCADVPTVKSSEENVIVVSNGDSVSVPELSSNQNDGAERSQPQPNRFRIFNNCTDEDLAALDDFDFFK